MNKTVRLCMVPLALILAFYLCFTSFAAPAYIPEELEAWTAGWETIKNDPGDMVLTPGTDETQMRFAWQTRLRDGRSQLMVSSKPDMSDPQALHVDKSLTLTGKWSNKAVATGLSPGSDYYYSYTAGGVWTEPGRFMAIGSEGLKALFLSDPQIGRSGDESLDSVLISDSCGFNATLRKALAAEPDISLILCAGDQVNTATSEIEYNALLEAKALRHVPFAAAQGNHDFSYPIYTDRFNNPNPFKAYATTSLGGRGYYFTAAGVLFVVLDSNNGLLYANEALLCAAVQAYPECETRVVMMHHPVYKADSGPQGNLLTDDFNGAYLARAFDRCGVDLVLTGHDHVYYRTVPMRGFKPAADGEGAVYVSAGSGSGSKYSGAPETAAPHIAFAAQSFAPMYSVLEFGGGAVTLNTYRADTMEKVDGEIVIRCGEQAALLDAGILLAFVDALRDLFAFARGMF
ncbi:MAG TPA: FN3 domain-containing metallophosphoesterase family protein [Clostridiales bacterium]|nr:FN3 domain-containing metallophosphoesterase family protein [Clostridiales bacterium]